MNQRSTLSKLTGNLGIESHRLNNIADLSVPLHLVLRPYLPSCPGH